MARGPDKRSMKDSTGLSKRTQLVNKKSHIGKLMAKYSDLDEVLYPYLSGIGMVYDEMDFTVEEFADITGAEADEIVSDLNAAIR